ncbi:MBL fold metallo-hydrolase [Salinadaptatus halalkaliphilus]|uniref:MBL fold metallo-hydrolase n=1 Tax=Salinadaptatus halalkaliphilus TaxID=2419781 RepID=A0A4S3TTN5_9EURY|nr:MBL fold metallo-hydrolase [Salinadaptatus halalkaliphilus]THE65988.1 MBL fold metallo-hydrolase [Salinadaptatus halalkaliphilus]
MAQEVAPPEHRRLSDGIYWTQECLPLGTLSELERFDLEQWVEPDEEVHGCQNAYLFSDEQNLLFDTLTQPNSDHVVDLIDELLDGEELDYLVISHPEANHAGNTFTILEAYPDATLLVPGEAAGYGRGHSAEHELYHIADETPEDVEQVPNEIQYVEPGESIDLGTHTVEFEAPPFPDHSFTLWMSERTTNTLFTVDWLGFLHQSANCVSFASELDRDVATEQVFRFHALAFPWMRFADLDEIERAVDDVRETFDPDVIAPAHGMVMTEELDAYLDLFLEAAEALSREGEQANMESKLEYILRPPEVEQ